MNLRSAWQSSEDSTGIASRVSSITISAIKQMPLLARGIPDCVSLGQGIPSIPTPPFITEAVIQALRTDERIGQYTLQPGIPQLQAEIGAYLTRSHGAQVVDPERETFVSCGGMEALACAITTVVERGDEVILFSPGYASHIEQVLFAEGIPVFVPLLENAEWSVDLDALAKAITPRTKAIIVCNPGNPTGILLQQQEVLAIAELAAAHNLFILADETYDFLVYDGLPFTSFTSLHQHKERVIACFSFSKQFCMTGWRVGFMFAAQRIIAQALKVHDAFAICAPAISQVAALAALEQSKEPNSPGKQFVDSLRQTLQSRRDLAMSFLQQMPEVFSCPKPQGAYYLFARYLPDSTPSVSLALELLQQARVICIPGAAFGPTGENHLRFSFGGSEATIITAFERIIDWTQSRR